MGMKTTQETVCEKTGRDVRICSCDKCYTARTRAALAEMAKHVSQNYSERSGR